MELFFRKKNKYNYEDYTEDYMPTAYEMCNRYCQSSEIEQLNTSASWLAYIGNNL